MKKTIIAIFGLLLQLVVSTLVVNGQDVKQPSIDDWKNGSQSPQEYKVNRDDDAEVRLKKQRINVALMEKEHFKQLEYAGVATIDVVFDSQRRLLHAKLDFHTDQTKIISAWEEALESAKSVESIVIDMHAGGETNIQEVGKAVYNRLDIEIQLIQAKKKFARADDKPPE